MVIGVDVKALEVGAAASAHAYEQGIVHIREEIRARDIENLDHLVETLTPEGPYAYTILPEVRPDGSVRLPILTSREQITEAYRFIRGMSDLHEVIGLTETCGSWYLFQDNLTRGSRSGSDQVNINQTVSLFPSGKGRGITGELVWRRVPRSTLGGADEVDIMSEDPLLARLQVHEQYERYAEGLRANDLERVLEGIHDDAASAVRDYVADTGTLVELTGKEEHRDWYGRFFDMFEVQSVHSLYRVSEEWYTFSELRLTVARRDGSGTFSYNTAEFQIPSKDGRFIARVGHGTEMV